MENFSLRNFGNSVYPALPVSFEGDTKSRQSLLSGVYVRGSKRPTSQHRNVYLSWIPPPTLNSPRSASMRQKTLPCTEKEELCLETEYMGCDVIRGTQSGLFSLLATGTVPVGPTGTGEYLFNILVYKAVVVTTS